MVSKITMEMEESLRKAQWIFNYLGLEGTHRISILIQLVRASYISPTRCKGELVI